MSKFDVSVEGDVLVLGLDSNEDGEKVLEAKLHLNEALQEAFKKGDAVEGVKVVDFKFSLTKLTVSIDTDKDGEKLLELTIDLAEAIDETGVLK